MTKYLSKHNSDSLPVNEVQQSCISCFSSKTQLWSCVLVVTFLPNGATSYFWDLQVLTHKKVSSLSDATLQNNWDKQVANVWWCLREQSHPRTNFRQFRPQLQTNTHLVWCLFLTESLAYFFSVFYEENQLYSWNSNYTVEKFHNTRALT